MAETRTRPARERQRAGTIIAAELWFWRKMVSQEYPSLDTMKEWRGLPVPTKIRRFMSAVADGDQIAVSEWESTPAAMSQITVEDECGDEGITHAEAQQLAQS